MKKIYKRILSLGLAVGVIFSLQESVHICAQENTQTTESIFADYGDENGGETDTAEQITGTGAEENTEQTTEETETGKNTEQTTETETGEIMDADGYRRSGRKCLDDVRWDRRARGTGRTGTG